MNKHQFSYHKCSYKVYDLHDVDAMNALWRWWHLVRIMKIVLVVTKTALVQNQPSTMLHSLVMRTRTRRQTHSFPTCAGDHPLAF